MRNNNNMNAKNLWLTFYSESWLHNQVCLHGWQWQRHAGPDWMGFCLHHHHNLCGLERDLVEGQWQGSEAAGCAQGGGLTVWVCAGKTGPGKTSCGGRQRAGGHRWWFASGIPLEVWEDFLQVSFGLLQLCQGGVDFQRTWHLHIQLTCGKQAETSLQQV